MTPDAQSHARALRRPPRGEADRLVVVLSDIEMGAGGRTDDFPHSAWLAELLLSYGGPEYDDIEVDFVFNGDTLDLLKTSFQGEHTHLITEEIAVGKLDRIAAVHGVFFEALGKFVRADPGRRRVWFVVGNHDIDLFFGAVRKGIRRRIDGPEGSVRFPGIEVDIGDVHIEHGSQGDPMFAIDPAAMFVQHEGERVLALPWGAVGLLEIVMNLQPLLCMHDRLRPRSLVFELQPEVEELLRAVAWRYWTRDYWRGWIRRRDPVKKISWTMFKEVAYRLRGRDFDLSVSRYFQKRLRASERYRIFVIGHEHCAAMWTYGNRKLLSAGCMRDEFMIEQGGAVLRPIPKSYVEVYLRNDRAVRSHLVELQGPPPAPGWMPESMDDALPEVRRLLASREYLLFAGAPEAQEALEAEDEDEDEDEDEGS